MEEKRDPELEQRLKEQFRGCCFGGAIHAYAVCDSTMERAHALVREGAGEGTLVFAARQTQGRGRMGRRWESPEGGAYFSLILRPSRPPTETPQLSLVAGLAAAEAIDEAITGAGPAAARTPVASPRRWGLPGEYAAPIPTSSSSGASGLASGAPRSASPAPSDCEPGPAATVAVSIRWPNDILLDGKKIAGILTEARDGAVVVGMGINVTTDPKDLPETATSLEKMVPGSERTRGAWHLFSLVAAVCTKFDAWYDVWTAQGFPPIREALRSWLNFGGIVRLTTGGSQVEGQALDVDEEGRLLVRLESGVMRAFEAGEVMLLRTVRENIRV